ncbi:hypothetical protein [Microvirga sp. M2]|uniref:hypothetical protein n=1 Tax=Microvirga sp. M2 TaxID=3073270 RepID=UPI0039C1A0DE
MFSHQDLWDVIDLVAQQRGMSVSGLARKAGLDPTAFNKSKRVSPDGRDRWPSTETLAKILSCTEMDLSAFATLLRSVQEQAGLPSNDSKLQNRGAQWRANA